MLERPSRLDIQEFQKEIYSFGEAFHVLITEELRLAGNVLILTSLS